MWRAGKRRVVNRITKFTFSANTQGQKEWVVGWQITKGLTRIYKGAESFL